MSKADGMKKGMYVALLAAVLGAGGLWYHSRYGGAASGSEVSAANRTGTMYNCAMHPQYISEEPGSCPICGMALTPMDKHSGGAEGPGTGVRIDSAAIRSMGVRTSKVEKRILSPEIRTSGKVAVDEARQFSVNARVAGWVEILHAASTGKAVRKGQPLLELYSPDLLATQEEYLQALRFARSLRADGEGASAASDLVESSRRRLANWGVSEASIRDLEKRGGAQRTLPVAAPASGVILEKMVLQGQAVSPGTPLFRIADLSRVWVVANAYQGDLARIKLGSPAEITLTYMPGRVFRGGVAFVSPVLDPVSRTAEVRIEVRNTAALDLKPEMFATVILRTPQGAPVVAIPEQSVIRTGRRNIAVIDLGGGRFEPRDVKLGATAGGYVEVLEGIAEGDDLVVSSQFLIDSESNLKAAIDQMQSRPDAAGAEVP